MATSSDAASRMSVDTYLCDCQQKARLFTSWSVKNPGRHFLGCSQPQGKRCNFFHWFDVEAEGRQGTVITQLNSRRYFLEEKVGLMEEKIGILEAQLAAKKLEKKELKKKTLLKLRICYVVIILLFAVVVMQFEKKRNGGVSFDMLV